ncbi:glycoside hydrolase TIM-barrel-like domain-containing protein, partial [bacterium]|nr:glycoside hydrolase TIM-barrel-like domain-containing protein [bacterium]
MVGGAIGGPIGATIGRAVGALAGSAIDNAIFAPEATPTAPPADLQLLGSNEGDAIPRLYGWGRVTGNIIWATELERETSLDSGSKGTTEEPEAETGETYLASFAVGLCEGKVNHVGRIWADGRLLETEGLDIRVHKGGENQSVNSLIESKQGNAKAPAYRGLAYLVFDGLPLTQFGNRIPNISVEICRVVGDLEPAVRAITVIPGSTEYGYDPEPRVRVLSAGRTANENTHALAQTSNWDISISQLVDLCPNLKHVALVVAWFGDDLRANQCKIQPRHEATNREIVNRIWTVSGQGRADVPVVTTHDGGPAYGGTPSDDTVLAAIADLKSRGLSVTLYPFVMMDIEDDNSLQDLYTLTSGQGAYPWRGRITCHPAPQVSGTPDQTSAAQSQIDSFVGSASSGQFSTAQDTISFSGGNDWGYRRMVLHYAHLCAMAGGVDAFLLGSEMRGLTQVRSGADTFPFVNALKTLAGDVRSVVGN